MGTMSRLIEEAGKPQDDDLTLLRNVKARGKKALADVVQASRSLRALGNSLSTELPAFVTFHGWKCESAGVSSMVDTDGSLVLSVGLKGAGKAKSDVWQEVIPYLKEALPTSADIKIIDGFPGAEVKITMMYDFIGPLWG